MGVAVTAPCFSLWRRQVLLDLVEAAGGIDSDIVFGRRAYLMLVDLAWRWGHVSVLGGTGPG